MRTLALLLAGTLGFAEPPPPEEDFCKEFGFEIQEAFRTGKDDAFAVTRLMDLDGYAKRVTDGMGARPDEVEWATEQGNRAAWRLQSLCFPPKEAEFLRLKRDGRTWRAVIRVPRFTGEVDYLECLLSNPQAGVRISDIWSAIDGEFVSSADRRTLVQRIARSPVRIENLRGNDARFVEHARACDRILAAADPAAGKVAAEEFAKVPAELRNDIFFRRHYLRCLALAGEHAIEKDAFLRQYPDDPAARFQLAAAYAGTRRPAEAAGELEHAMRIEEDRPHILALEAYYWARNAKPAEARKAAEAALRSLPGLLAPQLATALAAFAEGNHEETTRILNALDSAFRIRAAGIEKHADLQRFFATAAGKRWLEGPR
jgi:hypothetical protein